MNAASGLIIGSIVLSVLLLSGCAKEPETRAAPRPVRVFQVGERTNNDGIAYAGEVKARYETKLSFRVPGKVIARHEVPVTWEIEGRDTRETRLLRLC